MTEYYQNAPINSRTNGFPGNLIPGTGGAIKLRFEQEDSNRGKSGSYRIIYITLVQRNIYFLTAYAKKDQANLTNAQKQRIKKTIQHLRQNYHSTER
ncbi:MAG: type II toxin-antitoxin system RelE/ParE family toxin [Lentilactobacillus diolivorans]|uniref:type II toxin-antitoxin system RelE/ParE family toxin n=1 Tax=Lentilactobacillus diolivorans TaxID=179838 RepID=UPI0039ED715A